jgi:hypothetical protein
MMEKQESAQRIETPAETEPTKLEAAVAEIAKDAANKPKAYLEQTIVPEGGE